MQKRNVLNSPRLLELKKNRKKAIWGKFLISFFGLVAIFAFLAYISRVGNLNISEIKISGNKTIEADVLEQTIRGEISGKYLWLFPKTNILIYPQSDIKAKLGDNFKRLKDIKLLIEDNKVLAVSLDERTAKYLWCGENISSEGKCYFLDETGFVFDEAPYYSGDVYFKFYGKAGLDFNNPLGSSFAKEHFQQLIYLRDAILDMKLKPIALEAKDDGDVEIFLSNSKPFSSSPKILFKIDSDFQYIAENLDAALNTEPLKSKIKNKYSLLQYIDLRFGNKVYFKFNE